MWDFSECVLPYCCSRDGRALKKLQQGRNCPQDRNKRNIYPCLTWAQNVQQISVRCPPSLRFQKVFHTGSQFEKARDIKCLHCDFMKSTHEVFIITVSLDTSSCHHAFSNRSICTRDHHFFAHPRPTNSNCKSSSLSEQAMSVLLLQWFTLQRHPDIRRYRNHTLLPVVPST